MRPQNSSNSVPSTASISGASALRVCAPTSRSTLRKPSAACRVSRPRLVVGDAFAQQLEILAGGGALLGGDDEQAHRGLEQAASGEREVRAAQRVLADLGDPERDLADLQEV